MAGEELEAILEGAERAARAARAGEVRPEDVLTALVEARPRDLEPVFDKRRVTKDALAAALEPARSHAAAAGDGRAAHGAGGAGPETFVDDERVFALDEESPLPPAVEVAEAVTRASREALLEGVARPGPRDLLRALLEDRRSRAADVFSRRFGITPDLLRAKADATPGGQDARPHAGGAGGAAEAGLPAMAAGGGSLAMEVRRVDQDLSMLRDEMAHLRGRVLVQRRRLLWLTTGFVLIVVGALAAVGYVLLRDWQNAPTAGATEGAGR